MKYLSDFELYNITGGGLLSSIYNFYRYVKIKWLMKKVFID